VIQILLVAGDARMRERLRLALERLDVAGEDSEFIEVSDGNQAVAVAERRHPDLVVVEVGVTPYGAFGIARDIKASTEVACPVLVVLERPQDEWLARWSGADALVNRPVDPFALAEVARMLVEEHRGLVATPEEATS
jgi:DNA-binding response OmpR family regulator